MQFLFNRLGEIIPFIPTQYFLNKHLLGDEVLEESEESLFHKNFARKVAGEIILEPAVDLLVRSLLRANDLWIVECADVEEPVYVLKSRNMYLHIQHYPHMSDAFRVAPYPNKETLFEEFSEITVTDVKHISKDGVQQSLGVDTNTFWIEDGEE